MSRRKPRHIVLIVADSLRWDSVYLGGDHRLPYAARYAVRFDQARSSGSWTLPATASLFTGLIPHEHGATSQTRGLRTDIPTLAERLKRLGYRTHMVTANAATTHVFGLHRGFDTLDKAWHLMPPRRSLLQKFLLLLGQPRLRQQLWRKDIVMGRISEDLEAAKTWLQASLTAVFDRTRQLLDVNTAQGRSAFCFLNLMETHFPYHVADTFTCVSEGPIAKARELYNLYHLVNQTWLTHGERRRLQPEMLARLRQRQRLAWERMAPMVDDFFRELREHYKAEVVFCADHGDNFGEQGWQYHFSNVNDAGTRVPLLWLRHDRDEARIEPRPVSTRDVFGTLLRIAGHPDPTLANLLERPEHSLPVMQAYWYNHRGRTLPCFRYNQFAFVSGQRRYAHRIDRWYEAPITRADEPESPFRALEPGVDALEVALLSRRQAVQLRRIFRAYRQFSAQIMAAAR